MSTTPPPSCVPADVGSEVLYEPWSSVRCQLSMASAAASMSPVRASTRLPPYVLVREPAEMVLVTVNRPVPSFASEPAPGMPFASIPE
ncbi:hypothetical protein AB0368_09940 [Actinoplanes sp. NPDC051475]|uniref:hypothetical protein n=1 Tax=Actinoplanes sp. NPDC051475 TaxID=3157225 RepID=UPI00344DAA4F